MLRARDGSARRQPVKATENVDLGPVQVNEAAEVIYDLVDPNANLIFGAVVDTAMGQEVSITLIATGFGAGAFADSSVASYLDRSSKNAASPVPNTAPEQ